jgi:hypothetical protein
LTIDPPAHLREAGDKQQEVKSAAIGSIVTASPANINFDWAINNISPSPQPRKIETTPVVMDKKTFRATLEKIPYGVGFFGSVESKIVNFDHRPVAVVRIGRVMVPFYLSSGRSPMEGVTPGKWYPLLGISPKDGWFNKTPNMKDYYRSPKLLEAAKNLDRFIGDVRNDSENAPPVPPEGQYLARNFINRHMDPRPHSSLDPQKVYKHIERMAQRIENGVPPRRNLDEDGPYVIVEF